MKFLIHKILLIVFLTPLIAFSKETNLLCKGTYVLTTAHSPDRYERELNFSFDDKKQIVSSEARLFCDGLKQKYPLKVTTLSFSKNEVIFSHENDPREESGCISNLKLNRISGNLTTLQIIGDIYNPTILEEGTYKCEIAKPKF